MMGKEHNPSSSEGSVRSVLYLRVPVNQPCLPSTHSVTLLSYTYLLNTYYVSGVYYRKFTSKYPL